MPRSTNIVIVAGHLARDPELRYTATGKAVAKCAIAASEKWEKNGEAKESTTFIDVTAWQKLAERLNEARKGDYVYVVGKLATDSWEDKDSGQKRYKTYVNAEMINVTPKQGDSAPATPPPAAKPRQAAQPELPSGEPEEVPF